jgi:hypothetical protein
MLCVHSGHYAILFGTCYIIVVKNQLHLEQSYEIIVICVINFVIHVHCFVLTLEA